MALGNSLKGFRMEVNDALVAKAEALTPQLKHTVMHPAGLVSIEEEGDSFKAVPVDGLTDLPKQELEAGAKFVFDFGTHLVGYVTLKLRPAGSPPDAPLHLRLKLGERPFEIGKSTADYHGEISSGWLQEEFVHVDELPCELRLPRRYAFRYLELEVLATSQKYRLVIEGVAADAVSAVDFADVPPLKCGDELLCRIDEVGVRTLHDCMQDVYEDGPKRDRRMWLGDLRVQAQTNYVTFGDRDLIKRSLYLFAGLRQNEGRIGACLFVRPSLLVDDTFLWDYSLYFIHALADYYHATGDRETLDELYDSALRQVQIAEGRLDEKGLVRDSPDWWCFIDWDGNGLNKQAGAQLIFVRALRVMLDLACTCGRSDDVSYVEGLLARAIEAAMSLWDAKQGFFVSGEARQVSQHTQILAVLAEVLPNEEARDLLLRAVRLDCPYRPVTPYMHHFLVEALVQVGELEAARSHIKEYWGAMIAEGADTFYETFDPKNPGYSPYGGKEIESYCHAWSCTPSYFIRTYFAEEA